MSFSCWVHGCSYEDEKMCKRDSVKMYLVEGMPNTLVCESCYRSASGGELPMNPYFDWAKDANRDWDSSGLIWGLGWIEGTGFDELIVKLRGVKKG